MAKWIPVKERSRLYAYIINGNQAGTVVTLTLCGILAEQIGWESIFYVFGSFALLIGILWVTLIYSDPNDHPKISQAEKDFINEGNAISKEKVPPAPYLKILTSLPVWALIIVFFGSGWGYFVFLNMFPTYLNDIQHLNISTVSSCIFLSKKCFSSHSCNFRMDLSQLCLT